VPADKNARHELEYHRVCNHLRLFRRTLKGLALFGEKLIVFLREAKLEDPALEEKRP